MLHQRRMARILLWKSFDFLSGSLSAVFLIEDVAEA